MRRLSLVFVTALITALCPGNGFPQTQSGYDLFQQALVKERAEGNLPEAIQLYQRIVREFATTRPLAAKALVEMGECYEKLGKEEARKAYERVVRDYADQSEAATEARTRLAALNHGGPKTPGMLVRRVWSGPDVNIEGGPSWDGRYLSFVDWTTRNVALRDLVAGETRDVTRNTDQGSYPLSSRISPDGRQLAYNWVTKDASFDLRVIGTDGSGQRVLYSNKDLEYVEPTGWSPDGRTLLALFRRKDNANQIALVSVADGSARILKTLDWRYPNMALSPDGRYIAYDYPPRQDSEKRDIFVLTVDGSREIPLVQSPADDDLLGWAPDGKSILFASDRAGSVSAWAIRVADGKPQGSPELVRPNIGRVYPMGSTRDGRFYYGVYTSTVDVYLATLDPATDRLLDQPSPLGQHFMGTYPSAEFSPDGRELAYFAVKYQPPAGASSITLYIRSLATGEEREFPLDLWALGHPHWSPDGRSVLVTSYDKKRRQGLYEIDVQRGAVKPIVLSDPGTVSYDGVWTADGESFFYWRNVFAPKSSRIVLHQLATGREQELYRAPSGAVVTDLAPSPDGLKLAFTLASLEGGRWFSTLGLLPAHGGDAHELFRLNYSKAGPSEERIPFGGLAWTPDGKRLLFVREAETPRQGEALELWRISPQGGDPQKVAVLASGVNNYAVELRVHPDGKRIAFTAGSNKAEIWVMENFLPVLKASR